MTEKSEERKPRYPQARKICRSIGWKTRGEEGIVKAVGTRRILSKPWTNPPPAGGREALRLARAALPAGRARLPAEARALLAWLALKTHAASLTALSQTFGRDISTLSHALSRLEERSRKSHAFAKALRRHLYAISQA